MNRLLKSIWFVVSHLYSSKVYDVVFYYPQHFNRGKNNANSFFQPYLEVCQKHNLSYIVLEEPCKGAKSNINSTPFDFIFYLIKFLRRYLSKNNSIETDKYIGLLLSKIVLRYFNFNNVVVISKSMLSFFRGINNDARIFDLQHGIIYKNKSDYFINSEVSIHLKENDVFLLLFGNGFANILKKADASNFMNSHCNVIGFPVLKQENKHHTFNNNILVTLQFTHDHSDIQNAILLNELKAFVASVDTKVNFYLKHHPRFNNEVDLSEILELPNTHLASDDNNECFKLCSLHASTYSTSTFEASLLGIPTILIYSQNELNFFKTEFIYPLSYDISDFKDITIYQKSAEIVKIWANEYYSSYNELAFLNLLK